jgi:STE24 endopeptidase
MTAVGRAVLAAGVVLLWVGLPAIAGDRFVARSEAQAVPIQNPAPGKGVVGEPAYRLPPDKLVKAEALGRIRNILYFGDSLWGIVVLWLLLTTRAAARMEAWVTRAVARQWLQGLLYFALLILILTVTELPVGMYAHTVSRSYGISVEGWASWFGDEGKALGLSLALGAPLLLLIHWIVRRWPQGYWLRVWLVAVPLTVLVVFGSPWVEPMFNTYEPLAKSHAALVAALEKVVARTGTAIPPERMFLMKASEKTNGLNAYVSGLGATKRVVVWDTTADRIPTDEVLFVFAHESGHYVLHHIPEGLAVGAVGLFFIFWACSGVAGWLARRFGARWGLDAEAPLGCRAGFVVLLFAATIANFLVDPVSNAISRHFEHEADVYGQEATHGIVADPQKTAVASFNELGEAWLEDPDPNHFVVFWSYSHPSIQARAEFAAHYDPWAKGGKGKFFGQ